MSPPAPLRLSLNQRLAEWRAQVPLLRQISAAGTAVAVVTVLLVLGTVGFGQYSLARPALSEDLHTAASMLAVNAEAAVQFQDARGAGEILSALRASPDIREGRIVLADHSVLARYASESGVLLLPVRVQVPVRIHGEAKAQLQITADFSRQWLALLRYCGLVSLLLVFALILLRSLFLRALRVLWQPLGQLIGVMHRVTSNGDYSQRASAYGNNEVAELAHSFNAMLEEIEQRDARLAAELCERKRAEEQLAYIAHYDTLTGLPNRHAFNSRLRKIGQESLPAAMLLLDVDQFKFVNDSLGHFAGDALLQAISGRLHAAIQQFGTTAVVHRIGGDEFAVVVSGSHPELDAEALAQRFLEVLAEPHRLYGQSVYSTVSIGLACYPEHAADTHTLIRHADVALYAAKAAGRKRLCVFHASMNAGTAHSLALEGDLRQALLNDSLYLLYEPQIEVRSHRMIAAEALVRWPHPTLGLVSPEEFIPIAERSGLIIPLGEWVLRRACVETRSALQLGLCSPDFKVCVNLSPRQLADPKLVENVARILRDTGLATRNLEFEVTESSVVENIDVVAERMHSMCAMGITFAMDDFGVGATSLSYLKKLPLSKVKIDRSFVRDLPHDEDDVAIATAIIAMGHKLKKPVLAEGIERPEQLAFLHAHHCDMAQGYLLGRGAPLLEMLARPELAAPAVFDMRASLV